MVPADMQQINFDINVLKMADNKEVMSQLN